MRVCVFLPYPCQQFLIALTVSRTVHRDHIPPIALEIISILKTAPDIKRRQRFLVLPADTISLCCLPGSHFAPQLIILIDTAPVNIRYTGRILRPLHAPFYFKGIDTRLHQLWNMFDGAHIFQAQRIAFLTFCSARAHGIRQTAGLGTTPSVAAPAPEDAAEQALTRIAIAHRAMYESLHLCAGLPPHGSKFPQAKLSGRDDPACAHIPQQRGSPPGTDSHLRADMNLQSRKMRPDKAKHSQVLYNHGVQSGLIERSQIIIEPIHLLIL